MRTTAPVHLHTASWVIFRHINKIMSFSFLKRFECLPTVLKTQSDAFPCLQGLVSLPTADFQLVISCPFLFFHRTQALWLGPGCAWEVGLFVPLWGLKLFIPLLLPGCFLLHLQVMGPKASLSEALTDRTTVCPPGRCSHSLSAALFLYRHQLKWKDEPTFIPLWMFIIYLFPVLCTAVSPVPIRGVDTL